MIYPFIKRNNTEILSYHYIIICTGYHLMTKIVQNKCAIYLDIALPHRLQIRVYTCTRSVLAGYSTQHSQHTWLPQQGRHTHWYLEYEYHILSTCVNSVWLIQEKMLVTEKFNTLVCMQIMIQYFEIHCSLLVVFNIHQYTWYSFHFFYSINCCKFNCS